VIEVVNQAKAVLLSKHGVIVMGKDINETIRKAIFLEEVAQTAYLARTIGNPEPLDEKEAKRLYEFHHSNYGQK
jgi:L-ribulose-5-phosphate 4-epimerase